MNGLTRSMLTALAALLLWSPSVAAQTGSITGRVVDAQTGEGIPASQVYIATLDIGVLTQENGSYVIVNVPSGSQPVTVQRIGYAPVTKDIVVAERQTSVLDFRLTERQGQPGYPTAR